MELLQFTGEAKSHIHGLTKAIENLFGVLEKLTGIGGGASAKPKTVEFVIENTEKRITLSAAKIVAIAELDDGRASIDYGRDTPYYVKEKYVDAVKAWKGAL